MTLLEELNKNLQATAYKHVWARGGYKPHKYQAKFHESNKRYRALIAGIGSGKTLAGAAEVVKWALENPGSRYLVCAATYPLLKRSTIVEVMRFVTDDLIEYYNKADNELKFKNGSLIWFVSMEDPDKQGRGPTVAGVWVDEGSYITEYAFTILSGRIRQPGVRQGMWITTTPKGYNYLYKYFVDLPSKDKEMAEDYWYVQFSTRENPFLERKFIRGLETTHSGMFAMQEIEGQFVGFEGQVYPDFDVATHVGDFKSKQFKEILYGVDWGYKNPFVVLAMGIDGDGNMYVVEEFYRSGVEVEGMVKAASEIVGRWGKGRMICDPSEPGNIDTFNRHNLWANPGYNPIMEGIQHVSARLHKSESRKPSLYFDSSCQSLINELRMYHYQDNKDGKPVKDAPVKMDDHALDALRYMVMEVDKMRGHWSVLDNKDLNKYI